MDSLICQTITASPAEPGDLPTECKYPPAKPVALVCEPLKAARRGR
jgi:hypothetical protein